MMRFSTCARVPLSLFQKNWDGFKKGQNAEQIYKIWEKLGIGWWHNLNLKIVSTQKCKEIPFTTPPTYFQIHTYTLAESEEQQSQIVGAIVDYVDTELVAVVLYQIVTWQIIQFTINNINCGSNIPVIPLSTYKEFIKIYYHIDLEN